MKVLFFAFGYIEYAKMYYDAKDKRSPLEKWRAVFGNGLRP